MRILHTLLASMVLGATFGCVTATTAEPELSLTISIAPDAVKVGTEVRLKILLTNLTDHVVSVARIYASYGPELEYDFDVRNSEGGRVPLTRYGRSLHGSPDKGDENRDCDDCSGVAEDIQPHGKVTDEVVISKIYDLGEPGKYTIQVTRPQGDESHLVVKSNTITLTVTN